MTRRRMIDVHYPVCPHCRQRVINPGGHAEACTGPGLSERERLRIVAENSEDGGRAQKPSSSHSRTPQPNGSRSESPVQAELAPDHEIDPTTQAARTPGIDAVCQKVGPGGYAPDCGFPFCDCFVRGGS